MSKLMSKLHKSLTLRLLFSLSFFISGIIINLIQFIAFVTIGSINIGLYRRINYYLIYSSWSQIVAISEWWSHSSLRMYFADKQSFESHAKNHTLFVMNHRYELDWLMAWMCCDKSHTLGVSLQYLISLNMISFIN
jgi:lysophosphatidic acid acyltransferase/lysophosphatidylinositol acyltransferase